MPKAPAGRKTAALPADSHHPVISDFKPRKEWYFLSHFQLMRRTEGDRQILSTFVAPNVLLGILSSPGT